MQGHEEYVDGIVAQYLRERDRFEKLVRLVVEDLRIALSEFRPSVGDMGAGIDEDDLQSVAPPELYSVPFQVMSRTKDPERLHIKILGRIGQPDDLTEGASLDPTKVLANLKDLAGVRLLVYTVRHRDELREFLTKQWWPVADGASPTLRLAPPDKGDTNPRDMEPEKLTGRFYKAVHFRVTAKTPTGESANLQGVRCEVQLLTLPTHLWSELDHDVAYKTLNRKPGTEELELLASLGYTLNDVAQKMDRLWTLKIEGELESARKVLEDQDWEHRRYNEWGLKLEAHCGDCTDRTFLVTYPRSPAGWLLSGFEVGPPQPPNCPICESQLAFAATAGADSEEVEFGEGSEPTVEFD